MIRIELGLPEITINFISSREVLADQQAHIFEIFIDAYYKPSQNHDEEWRKVMSLMSEMQIAPVYPSRTFITLDPNE